MYVGWNYCETGAPEIDPKRPYGNSWVPGDIHEILCGEYPKDDLEEEVESYYMKLHKETETALQIVLCTKSFQPGKYVKENVYNDKSWKLVK